MLCHLQPITALERQTHLKTITPLGGQARVRRKNVADDKRDPTFKLTITALSHVHISSGNTLTRDVDFLYDASSNKTSFVLNDNAVAYLLEDEEHPEWLSLSDILKKAGIKPTRQNAPTLEVEGLPLVRYMLTGAPSSKTNSPFQPLLEQIKDVFDRAYIPGSSLKGAIRTALAWSAFPNSNLDVSLAALRVNGTLPIAKFAAQNYEQQLFHSESSNGSPSDAHTDVLRAMRISDSTPITKELLLRQVGSTTDSSQPTELGNRWRSSTNVQNHRKPIPLPDIETIPKLAECTMHLQFDRYALLPHGTRQDFSSKAELLTNFVAACRERGMQLIEHELAFYNERKQTLPNVASFYQDLSQKAQRLDPNSFMLQIGWGTGWHSKTLDERLTEHTEEFNEIANYKDYKLKRGKAIKPGDIFPISRKLIKNDANVLSEPLGWVRVDVAEVAR
ncbi:type III-A CRISPR-associated RAMP protein Csm5 [Chloroflexia bacterium SDU3-3]|nr:type III-A CRISPR-associated RAMP protein Csm5 [Chloroflexia bacterium SDU3-3]